jgi:DAK2 domain fusion protein YloV
MARAALLGARGNSGLILAQFFKGLADSLADGYEVSGEGFARALRIASDNAYRAVPQPKEGTMLTVFRECADAAEKTFEQTPGLEPVMAAAVDQAMDTVARTPQMLDVLKEAGVVDSGGFGFAVMLSGGLQALRGEGDGGTVIGPPGMKGAKAGAVSVRSGFVERVEEEAWGYCTVFAIEGEGLDPDRVRKRMSTIGRSAVVAGSDTLLKVHVHMEDPGKALTAGSKLGTLSNIDIKNMDEQTREWAKQRTADRDSATGATLVATEVETAIVAVVLGEGFEKLFQSAGLNAVVTVPGGDTMNPSTAELLAAVEKAPSRSVIILPNNKNVIGGAEQVASLTDKKVIVIPSRSMQQGLAALLEYSPDRPMAQNSAAMDEALSLIRSGSVCRASRDALLNGVAVSRGQFMGVLDDKLVAAGNSAQEVLNHMLRGQVDEESLVTLYSGGSISTSESTAAARALSRALGGVEVESLVGGQPNYEFLVAIE